MTVTTTSALTTPRLTRMAEELRFAWSQSDSRDLQRWGLDVTTDLASAFSRRISNIGGLAISLAKSVASEARAAYAAYEIEYLDGHLENRARTSKERAIALLERAGNELKLLQEALRDNPAEVGPRLLVALVTSLAVSGGPDADGGAPDLDLLFGIGAHRSILSHSILMGSTLEAGFLSLLRLSLLVHSNLPVNYDPRWDELAQHARQITSGALTGAGVGMSYHLIIDGLVTPAAFHDLPFSAPMAAHTGIIVVNGLAEAQDLRHKPSFDQSNPDSMSRRGGTGSTTDPASAAVRTVVGEEFHRAILRVPLDLSPIVAGLLLPMHLDLICKRGSWMAALATGTLEPISDAQREFILVSHFEAEPLEPFGQAWRAYSLALIAVMLTARQNWFQRFRALFKDTVEQNSPLIPSRWADIFVREPC